MNKFSHPNHQYHNCVVTTQRLPKTIFSVYTISVPYLHTLLTSMYLLKVSWGKAFYTIGFSLYLHNQQNYYWQGYFASNDSVHLPQTPINT